MPSQVELGPTVRPSVSLSPSQVVAEQFKALSRGRVGQDRDGVSGIDAALAFVAPNIVEMRGTELNTRWLGGDGLWLPDTHACSADGASGCPGLRSSHPAPLR